MEVKTVRICRLRPPLLRSWHLVPVRFALSKGPGVRLSTSAQAMFMKIAGICLSRRAGPTSWPAIAASAMWTPDGLGHRRACRPDGGSIAT